MKLNLKRLSRNLIILLSFMSLYNVGYARINFYGLMEIARAPKSTGVSDTIAGVTMIITTLIIVYVIWILKNNKKEDEIEDYASKLEKDMDSIQSDLDNFMRINRNKSKRKNGKKKNNKKKK